MLTQPLGNRDLGASVFPIVFGELAFPLAPGWLLWAKIAMGPPPAEVLSWDLGDFEDHLIQPT